MEKEILVLPNEGVTLKLKNPAEDVQRLFRGVFGLIDVGERPRRGSVHHQLHPKLAGDPFQDIGPAFFAEAQDDLLLGSRHIEQT